MLISSVIRFDERENSFMNNPPCFSPHICGGVPKLPEASRTSTTNSYVFPPNGSTVDVAGWLYIDLNNHASAARPSQNWLTISMFAQGHYSVDFDAAALGNGCSATAPSLGIHAPIGPSP